jgi:hypothetical protein
MKKAFGLLCVTCIISMLFFIGYWWITKEDVFTDEFALKKIFGNYNAQCDCAEIKGTTAYYKSNGKNEYGELYVFNEPSVGRRGRQDSNRHQVVLISNLEDGAKLVVTTTKSFDEETGEFLDCNGCGSWLSVGIFKKVDSKWILADKAVNLFAEGALGHPPEIHINNKGSQEWFDITVEHYAFRGDDEAATFKLVYRKGKWSCVDPLTWQWWRD